MNFLKKLFSSCSKRARSKRGDIFRSHFRLDQSTRIIDLGSESGGNISNVLSGTPVLPENVFIADIDQALIEAGAKKYGYNPVLIGESGILPFEDGYFDIVFCSSVIEHVTISKDDVWEAKCGKEFRRASFARQKQFAEEIERIGRQHYVQTPYIYFPIESHTWLPFAGWLPRRVLIMLLRLTNRFWIKTTKPDWNLLNVREMKLLFPKSIVVREKSLGMTKSIMSIKTDGVQ